MHTNTRKIGTKLFIGSVGFALALSGTQASAAVALTKIDTDISSNPYTFSFLGSTFSFDGSGGFPSILSVKTSGDAAVRTVFGSPSTDFVNRGTVVYDSNTLGGFGSFADFTSIPFTNGDNFLGLRVTSGGEDYYGFAYTTNAVLNGVGFETTAGKAITATTNFASAVPEPATWALLMLGFAALGGMLRSSRRREKLTVSYS